MPEQQTLQERLAAAQREAEGWRTKLNAAEAKLADAVNEKAYAAAEQHKAAADAAREPLLIAEAHVQALNAGVQALAQHQQAENLARQERERREQATQLFHAAQERETEALDEMQRYMAEVQPAYQALRLAMEQAIEAERRAGMARTEAHETGKTAGLVDPGLPRPARPNAASARFESHPTLVHVLRNPQLF